MRLIQNTQLKNGSEATDVKLHLLHRQLTSVAALPFFSWRPHQTSRTNQFYGWTTIVRSDRCLNFILGLYWDGVVLHIARGELALLHRQHQEVLEQQSTIA